MNHSVIRFDCCGRRRWESFPASDAGAVLVFDGGRPIDWAASVAAAAATGRSSLSLKIRRRNMHIPHGGRTSIANVAHS